MISDTRQSTLTADGRFREGHTGSGPFIGRARVHGVTARHDGTAAAGVIKLHDGTDATRTVIYHGRFGKVEGDMLDQYIPGEGLRFKVGIYVDLTNCTSVEILYS